VLRIESDTQCKQVRDSVIFLGLRGKTKWNALKIWCKQRPTFSCTKVQLLFVVFKSEPMQSVYTSVYQLISLIYKLVGICMWLYLYLFVIYLYNPLFFKINLNAYVHQCQRLMENYSNHTVMCRAYAVWRKIVPVLKMIKINRVRFPQDFNKTSCAYWRCNKFPLSAILFWWYLIGKY